MFYRLEFQLRKKMNIKCREFQLILQIIAMEINLTITMIYLQLETRIMHYINLWNRFFDSNWQRKTPTVIHHLSSSPRQPILHSNIFFYAKLFAIIILPWNSFKCILWYLLKLSDPFIKNENSVLPILIEKNFEQKIYFCLLKMRSIFLKKGNPIFSINRADLVGTSKKSNYLGFFFGHTLK